MMKEQIKLLCISILFFSLIGCGGETAETANTETAETANTETAETANTETAETANTEEYKISLKYDKVGTSCNNDRYCRVSMYKVKIEGDRWKTTSLINSPYIAKKGEVVFIGFGNNFTNPTLLKLTHNIQEKDIVDNKLSLLAEDRGKKQWIVFKVTQDIALDLSITHETSTQLNAFCFNKTYGSKTIKVRPYIYKLNDDLEKEYFIKNASTHYLSYDTKDYNSNENLLIECHDSNGLLYSGIIHTTKSEYWNLKSFSSPNRNHYGYFKVDYLTDIYFQGYKNFKEKGYSSLDAKEKSSTKVKSIFKNYKPEYIGEVYYAYNGTTYSEVNSISNSLANQLNFIEYVYKKNNEYITSREIINSISNYLFEKEDIDDYLKVNFFQDKLELLSKNNFFNGTNGWKKEGTTSNTHATGEIFTDKDSLNITLVSNRKYEDSLSLFRVKQTLDIKSLDKENLYFKASIKEIYGQEDIGKLGLSNCSGMAGITLTYLNNKNEVIGYTSIVNMTDNIFLGINTISNEAETAESTDFRHVIRTKSIKEFRAIVLNIKDEIKNIPKINSIDEIDKIEMILFTSDYFTEGVKYYWGYKLVPSCTNAKAFLRIREAGIYKLIN